MACDDIVARYQWTRARANIPQGEPLWSVQGFSGQGVIRLLGNRPATFQAFRQHVLLDLLHEPTSLMGCVPFGGTFEFLCSSAATTLYDLSYASSALETSTRCLACYCVAYIHRKILLLVLLQGQECEA